MANRFNGGRGAITCDSELHDGRMICSGVAVADEPPYLPMHRPAAVYHPEAVWIPGDDGHPLHYCSAECADNNPGATPLFPPDMPPHRAEMPRIFSADVDKAGEVTIKGPKG